MMSFLCRCSAAAATTDLFFPSHTHNDLLGWNLKTTGSNPNSTRWNFPCSLRSVRSSGRRSLRRKVCSLGSCHTSCLVGSEWQNWFSKRLKVFMTRVAGRATRWESIAVEPTPPSPQGKISGLGLAKPSGLVFTLDPPAFSGFATFTFTVTPTSCVADNAAANASCAKSFSMAAGSLSAHKLWIVVLTILKTLYKHGGGLVSRWWHWHKQPPTTQHNLSRVAIGALFWRNLVGSFKIH